MALLGIDLGTSGLRLAVVDANGRLQAECSADYPTRFEDPLGWREGLIALCGQLPDELRAAVAAIAIDGTSGTVLLCRPDGALGPAPLAQALPYHQACPEQAAAAAALVGVEATQTPAASASGSLARALLLLELACTCGEPGPWWLRQRGRATPSPNMAKHR